MQSNRYPVTVPSTRADLITRRTYNRPLEDGSGAFETWEQTVDRVIRHQTWLWERAKGASLTVSEREELEELHDIMMHRVGTPSGRTLWLGGTDVAKTREASQFNCAFKLTETVHDVVDGFWNLLQGCGQGFKPVPGILSGFTQKTAVEIIRSAKVAGDPKGAEKTSVGEYTKEGLKHFHITVGDSAEAWSKLPGKLLALKGRYDVIVLDFSEIRAGGIRLKGYGWISSGDETISIAMKEICDILNHRAGQLLTHMDILDVMNWLGTTLSSRRSAEIALLDAENPEIEDFIAAKMDFWDYYDADGNKTTAENGGKQRYHRQQSNNSIVFWRKPDRAELDAIFDKIIAAGGSEPGFLNGQAAHKRAAWFKGVNPCLSGDTIVSTALGLRRISDLAGEDHVIWDGNGNAVTARFEKTSDSAEVVRVTLSDGSEYTTTPNHNWVLSDGSFVRADELSPGQRLKVADLEGRFGIVNKPGQAYLDAWLIADGTWYNDKTGSKLYLYGEKKQYAEALESVGATFREDPDHNRVVSSHAGKTYMDKSKVPAYVLEGTQETVSRFIEGYTQSDGHVGKTDKGWVVQYTSIHRSFLQDLQSLLRLFGVRSTISLGHKAADRLLPDGKGGMKEYSCRTSYRLTVSNPSQFFLYFYPENNVRGPYKKTHEVSVVSVEALEERIPVYCAGVPTTNSFDLAGIHTGNCAEILLGNKSFCNLVTPDWGKLVHMVRDEALRVLWILGRANYRQTCVNLRDGILQDTWHELNEFLRLCGVGAAGIVKMFDALKDNDAIVAWLKDAKFHARSGAISMADELGLPRPKAVTTVKPDGTIGKMMDTTEGVHRPLGKYIFNNVTYSKHDEVLPMLAEAGYKVWEKPFEPESMLVTFPVAYEDVEFDLVDGKYVNMESAVEQLERYKLLMVHYVDHNCSITVSYDPTEVPAIVDWILENWDIYVGVSFIFRNDPTKTAKDLGYAYLPQEVVTEESYSQYVQSLKPVSLSGMSSLTESTDDDCATGMCPIR